jgi:uncharacterized protein with GYD domain
MAIFIMLSRLSPEGTKTLRDNPQRIQEVNREVEGFGARVVQQYALLGHHDFLTVLEAPDAETVSRVSVELSSRATGSYETLPAIEVEEFVARLRGEGGAREAPRLTDERSEVSGARPAEGAASEAPPREQAREDVEDIKEEIRREEGSRRGTQEGPQRKENTPPQRRERARQPETEREEDRGLVDRARDAVLGSDEEEPRRREEPDRPERR